MSDTDAPFYSSKTGKYFVLVLTAPADTCYGVVNTETGKTEYTDDSLPQCIGVAEQYDFMLTNATWERMLESMYGPYQPSLSLVPSPDDSVN